MNLINLGISSQFTTDFEPLWAIVLLIKMLQKACVFRVLGLLLVVNPNILRNVRKKENPENLKGHFEK